MKKIGQLIKRVAKAKLAKPARYRHPKYQRKQFYEFSVATQDSFDIKERIDWLNANIKGKYSIDGPETVSFDNANDAMLYKMTWL